VIKAALFDVDGTLVDSNTLHVEAWHEAFQHYGKDVHFDDIFPHIGKGADQLMPNFLSRDELQKFGSALEQFRTELFTHDYLAGAEPFPKVRELFERLKRDGVLIALASSAKQTEVEQHQKNLHVEDLVDELTSADDAEHSKPCPDIFQAALARLEGVAPEEAIVIGDTPYDVQAAAGAGMTAIGLLSGGFSEESLRDAGAIEIYTDIAELLERYDDSPFARESQSVRTEPWIASPASVSSRLH
jgi:HAD superfamily hydrolase (TIGR01509 family)